MRHMTAVWTRLIKAITGTACAFVVSVSVSGQEAQEEQQVLYGVGDFVREWGIGDIEISPNGKLLAFTAPVRGQTMLLIGTFDGGPLKPVSSTPFNDIIFPVAIYWASNDMLVLEMRQKIRMGRTSIYTWGSVLASMKADGSDLQLLRTDGRGDKSSYTHIDNTDIISLLRSDPDHILVGKSRRRNWIAEYYDGAIDDVYKLNIKTGEVSLYLKGPKISGFKFNDWYADHEGHIRLGYGYDRDDNSVIIIRGRGDDDWKVLSDNELFEEGKFGALRFGKGDNEFYVLSSLATGRMAVYEFDIASGKLGDLVFQHDLFDVTGIVYSNKKGKVVAANYNDGGYKIKYLDEDYEKVRDRISRALKTPFSIRNTSDDDDIMLVSAGDERDAGSFFYYDVKAARMRPLGSRLQGLQPKDMAPMDSVYYETRDGLEVTAILTKPRLHGDTPLPFIILPHTDPNGRDSVEWDSAVQFFANRGYGVFQPNYRGSSGFGNRFRALGRGEWGRDMQNDLIDGVEWLIDEGHADETKICIIGRNYAGYAALMAAINEGDLFACAVARDAPVDLASMMRDDDIYDEDDPEYQAIAGGLEKKELDQYSPLKHVSELDTPVLLYHREDSAYEVRHTQKFVKALSKGKKQFDYFEVPERKGADLYDPTKDLKLFLTVVEGWLANVNPTPLLLQAYEEGKAVTPPPMTKTGRPAQ